MLGEHQAVEGAAGGGGPSRAPAPCPPPRALPAGLPRRCPAGQLGSNSCAITLTDTSKGPHDTNPVVSAVPESKGYAQSSVTTSVGDLSRLPGRHEAAPARWRLVVRRPHPPKHSAQLLAGQHVVLALPPWPRDFLQLVRLLLLLLPPLLLLLPPPLPHQRQQLRNHPLHLCRIDLCDIARGRLTVAGGVAVCHPPVQRPRPLRHVLVAPPDAVRLHHGAGRRAGTRVPVL